MRARLADIAQAQGDKTKQAQVQFEAVLLNSFVSEMLPKDTPEAYGQGLAGDMWRSMLADQVSRKIASSGALGIGQRLFATHPMTASSSLTHTHPSRLGCRGACANERQRSVGAERRRQRRRRIPVFERQTPMKQKSTDDNEIGVGEARSLAMILPVVGRLRMAVGAENRDLAQRRVVDYRTHSARKSPRIAGTQRLRMALATARTHPAARAALADLLGELDINRRLLHVQLRAAQTCRESWRGRFETASPTAPTRPMSGARTTNDEDPVRRRLGLSHRSGRQL